MGPPNRHGERVAEGSRLDAGLQTAIGAAVACANCMEGEGLVARPANWPQFTLRVGGPIDLAD